MNELQQLIESVLAAHGCKLYQLDWLSSQKPPVLQVAAEKADGSMDLDTCALLSEALSEKLDAINWGGDKEYMLEVCSPGAERELRTPEQLEAAVGKHVCVKLKNPKEGLSEVTGDLVELGPETMTIAWNQKGRKKKTAIDRDNVALVRMAVKF